MGNRLVVTILYVRDGGLNSVKPSTMADRKLSSPGAPKPIFETDAFRRRLSRAAFRSVPAGGEIIVQGRQGKAAFFIASGEVEVLSDTPMGPVRLATLAAPRLVGEVGALAGLPPNCEHTRIDKRCPSAGSTVIEMMALGREEPDLLLSIIAELGRQVEASIEPSVYTQTLSVRWSGGSSIQGYWKTSRILRRKRRPSLRLFAALPIRL